MGTGKAPSKKPNRNLHLGFGSLQFQVTGSAPEKFTGAEYLDWIKEALGQIAAVGNIVTVAHERQYEQATWDRPKEPPSYSETGLAQPPLEFVEIAFTLHVAQRVQKQLAEKGLGVPASLGENFVVKIRDGWQMPHAMVWPPGCDLAPDASSAVIVVREVLKQEFERLKNPRVSPEWLGPSPAHFTANLEPAGEEQDEDFLQTARRRNGYHSYTFSYRDDLGDPENVADMFFLTIDSELDLHYRIVRAQRHQGGSWGEAVRESEKVLDAYRKSGIRASFARLFQGGRINRVLIALGEIELTQAQGLQLLQTEFDSTYVQGDHVLIRNVVEDQLREFKPIPIGPIASLLELFESRKRTARAVLIATVSSLIGAAVAAAATLIAGAG